MSKIQFALPFTFYCLIKIIVSLGFSVIGSIALTVNYIFLINVFCSGIICVEYLIVI